MDMPAVALARPTDPVLAQVRAAVAFYDAAVIEWNGGNAIIALLYAARLPAARTEPTLCGLVQAVADYDADAPRGWAGARRLLDVVNAARAA